MNTKITKLFIPFILLFNINLKAQQWNPVGATVLNGTDSLPSSAQLVGFGSNMYCGTDSGLFVSPDNGVTWQNITYNKPNILKESAQRVFVAGNGDMYVGTKLHLFKSTDNGSSWNRITTIHDSLYYRGIAEIGGNIVVSYHVNFATGGAYYSSDNGVTWTQSTGLANVPKGRFLVDGNTLYLGGEKMYKSTDNGQSFSIAGTTTCTIGTIWDVAKLGNGIFGGDIGGGGLIASMDNGNTWNKNFIDTNNTFCQVFSVIEGCGALVMTTSGGSVCNGIKTSLDTGKTWVNFSTGLPGFVTYVGRNSNGSSFFCKSGKKVYRYDNACYVAGIKSLNSQITQASVYPNPSNGNLTIKLSGAVPDKATIKIFNTLGQPAFQHNIQEALSNVGLNLPAGIYFYRIESNERTISDGKLIIN
ncbi:MAG: T9SS type A sorting domain-containing protein [Bacteroidia bacterium]